MKKVNVKCMLCIAVLALAIVNQAESCVRGVPDVVV